MASSKSTNPKTALLESVVRAIGIAAADEPKQIAGFLDDQFVSTRAQAAAGERELQEIANKGLAALNGKCIRLRSWPKHSTRWVPFLWLAETPFDEVAMQVVVAGKDRRFGFRWEPPEGGPGGVGKHDYYHAQPIISVRISPGASVPLDLSHDHIVEDCPTLPIDARDSVHLLDALLVSLYGPMYPVEFGLARDIQKSLQKESKDRGWGRLRAPATPVSSHGKGRAR